MSGNHNHPSRSTKHTISTFINIDEVGRDTLVSYRASLKSDTDFCGVVWFILAQKSVNAEDELDYLDIYLGTEVHQNRKTTCDFTFTIRVMANSMDGGVVSHTGHRHAFPLNQSPGYGAKYLVEWNHLVEPSNGYEVNGIVKVEVDFETDMRAESQGNSMRRDTWSHQSSVSYRSMLFTDMHIGVEGHMEKIACNKNVVCRHSRVIADQMADRSSKAFKTGIFPISGKYANLLTAKLFVRAMYDVWDAGEMDDHAAALLHLASVYESDRVERMAALALQRLLNDSTFWRTLRTAVTVTNNPLIDVCVSYANKPRDKLWQLVNRRETVDGEYDRCARVLLKAFAERKEMVGVDRSFSVG